MSEVTLHLESKSHFEALVFSAALQLLEHFKLPAERDDRNMYMEHPERWPLTERALRQPSGKRGKGFNGLTHGMREWLKYGSNVEGPPTIVFGLKALAWWHREVWNDGMKHTRHKTFGGYVSDMLINEKLDARLSAEEADEMRKLYGVERVKAAV